MWLIRTNKANKTKKLPKQVRRIHGVCGLCVLAYSYVCSLSVSRTQAAAAAAAAAVTATDCICIQPSPLPFPHHLGTFCGNLRRKLLTSTCAQSSSVRVCVCVRMCVCQLKAHCGRWITHQPAPYAFAIPMNFNYNSQNICSFFLNLMYFKAFSQGKTSG